MIWTSSLSTRHIKASRLASAAFPVGRRCPCDVLLRTRLGAAACKDCGPLPSVVLLKERSSFPESVTVISISSAPIRYKQRLTQGLSATIYTLQWTLIYSASASICNLQYTVIESPSSLQTTNHSLSPPTTTHPRALSYILHSTVDIHLQPLCISLQSTVYSHRKPL